MDWCWHCFADGMAIYYDKDWIMKFPQVATDSNNWMIYLSETNDYYHMTSFFEIKKPKDIEWNDIMINGFKFLIEDHLNTEIDIVNYFVKDDYLMIYFTKK